MILSSFSGYLAKALPPRIHAISCRGDRARHHGFNVWGAGSDLLVPVEETMTDFELGRAQGIREAATIARRHQMACASMGMPRVEVAGLIESSILALLTPSDKDEKELL